MKSAPEDNSIAALILAAGNSSRLGKPKQLLQIQGQSLLARTMDTFGACDAISRIVTVTGSNAAMICSHTQPAANDGRFESVVNADWQSGMGSSISCGMRFLEEQCPDVTSVVISVCDQPFLETSHLIKLVERAGELPGKIIASAYDGTMGPPVLFPDTFWTDLVRLRGDRGAKDILRKFKDDVVTVDFPQGGIDIDTPADLARIRPG